MHMHDSKTFDLELDGYQFTFAASMTIRQQIRMRRIAQEIWGDELPEEESETAGTPEFNLTSMLAELEAACVSAPVGWDWEAVSDLPALLGLWEEYRHKRDSFRGGVASQSVPANQGGSEESEILVPAALQTDAD